MIGFGFYLLLKDVKIAPCRNFIVIMFETICSKKKFIGTVIEIVHVGEMN